MPSTANRAYMRCLISAAMVRFSSSVYCSTTTSSFLPGVGKRCLEKKKMSSDTSIITTDAMKL